MRRIFLASVMLVLIALPLWGQGLSQDWPPTARQIGEQKIANPATSTALTVPSGTQWIVMTVDGAAIHIRFDGLAATTNSLKLPVNVYRTNRDTLLPPAIRIINSAEGAATVYVTYWRQR